MNDLISRQAAIRWVKTECNPYGKPTLEFESGKKVIEHLEQMPSAQPEIIHCKDCKNSEHWYRDRRRCFLWAEEGVSVFDDGFCNYAERRQDALN